MNYIESDLIKMEIDKATNVLISCHAKPDVDSVASALALKLVLTGQGKQTVVVCPDEVSDNLGFLEGWKEIQKIDYASWNFSKFDLFFILDAADWGRVTGNTTVTIPKLRKVVIDHHRDNPGYGDVNLIDGSAGSTSEILYLLCDDIGYEISRQTGEAIVAGMAGDSSGFRNTGAGARAFKIMAEMMEMGVDKSQIITNIYGTMTLESLGLLGEVLKRLQADEKYKFVWAEIPFDIYSKYPDASAVGLYAGTFLRSVKDTDFGIMLLEKQKGEIDMSIKARTNYDVSGITKALGGEGHKRAGGGTIKCDEFETKVEEVLDLVRQSVLR